MNDDVCLCVNPDFKPTAIQPGGSRWPICQRCGGYDRELQNPIRTVDPLDP